MTKAPIERHPLFKPLKAYIDSLEYERRLSPLSINVYSYELRRLLLLLEDPVDTLAVKQHLRALAPATATRKIVIWRNFLKSCVSEWAASLDKIALPKIRQKQPLFLTEQEAFALEHACYRSHHLHRDRLLVALMLQLGLRLSEVIQLRFRDFEGAWLRILRKGGKEQRLPLSPQLKVLFESYKALRTNDLNSLIFEGRGREQLTPKGVQEIIERLRKSAGIEKKISPHSLRHTFASQLAAKGASLVALKELLGHQKITTTERYLHTTPDHLRQTLNLLK